MARRTSFDVDRGSGLSGQVIVQIRTPVRFLVELRDSVRQSRTVRDDADLCPFQRRELLHAGMRGVRTRGQIGGAADEAGVSSAAGVSSGGGVSAWRSGDEQLDRAAVCTHECKYT